MGMFDNVKCEVPLPDGYSALFQTKDLDNMLTTYKISEEGRLLKTLYELQEDDEAPLGRWLVGIGWEDTNFHGVLRFYDYDHAGLPPAAPHDPSRWHEYSAKFTDGQLAEIVVAPKEAA